jgi:peptidoglycan hydrolase CwlO-like protein
LWDYYDLEVAVPLLDEYGRSLLPGSVDNALFQEAMNTTAENNRFANHRNNMTLEIDRLVAEAERLEKDSEELESKVESLTIELQDLQNSMDNLNRERIKNNKLIFWRRFISFDFSLSHIRRVIYNRKNEFKSTRASLEINGNKIIDVNSRVTALRDDLNNYNENINSIEGRLTAYRGAINKIRKIIKRI